MEKEFNALTIGKNGELGVVTEEFDLSEKQFMAYMPTEEEKGIAVNSLDVTDVKEFIKKETEAMRLFMLKQITWQELMDERDKLAGKDLID